ncbi:MAG TPA: hypothetical protein VIX86_11070 [Streptosporangiaceae bacterium]
MRSLAQLIADADRGMDQAIRARAERPPASGKPFDWTGEDSALGESGGGADLGQSLFDFAVASTAYLLRQTVGRRLKQYYRERLLPEAGEAREAHRRNQLQLAERYPDLRVCISDQMIFVAGGSRAIPLDRLARHRPADLDAAIGALVAELRAP